MANISPTSDLEDRNSVAYQELYFNITGFVSIFQTSFLYKYSLF